jgi:hypothetical protein
VIVRNAESGTRNVIKGTVEVDEPQGTTTILQINIGQEKKIIAQINEQWGPEAGESLTLTVATELILFSIRTPIKAFRIGLAGTRTQNQRLKGRRSPYVRTGCLINLW